MDHRVAVAVAAASLTQPAATVAVAAAAVALAATALALAAAALSLAATTLALAAPSLALAAATLAQPTAAVSLAAAAVSLAAAALALAANDLPRHLRYGRRHSLPGWGLGCVWQLVRLWDRLRRLWLTPPPRPANQSTIVPPATTFALTATTPATLATATLATATFATAAFVTATLVAALAAAADGSLTGLATGDAQRWAATAFAALARPAPTPSASIRASAFAAAPNGTTSPANEREGRALHGDRRPHTDGQRQRGRLL